MTRKDFQLIADVLRYDMDHAELYPDAAIRKAGCADRAKRMARALSTTNPNFDRDRFLTACGVNP
jgi:hypothetical protein